MENVSGMRSTANGDFVREIEAELSRVGKMKVKSKMLFAPITAFRKSETDSFSLESGMTNLILI